MSSAAPRPPVADVTRHPPVSVVMTVLNEARHLTHCVEHVLSQDYPGQLELVIALGPSTDGTDRVAAKLSGDPRVRTVPNPTGATPAGLNAAVAAAHHDVIARVDGHAMLPVDYVRTAVDVLRHTGADNVGGIMAAEGVTPFERAVARAMASRLGVGSAPFHTGGDAGPADTVYLGVFHRSALQRIGGYDESFLRAQDWELNYRIRRTGGLVYFTPRLRVAYRPRGNVRALARQYRDYGRWRRVVMREHPGSVQLRYLAPPAAVLAVAAGAVAGAVGWRRGLVVPVSYAAANVVGSALVGRDLPPDVRRQLPLVVAVMHASWGYGFLTSPRSLRPDGAESQQLPAFQAAQSSTTSS